MQIRNRDHDGRITAGQYVRGVLDLPDSLEVEAVIALGYPAEEKEGVPLSDLPDTKIRSL
ncbi:MAG: hypothetical protein ACLFS7_00145 [Desulfosudaceae bacterium]